MEPVIGSARLFEAFEKSGLSPGADLRSAFGPGGAPADELIRAFEKAMEPSGNVPGMEAAQKARTKTEAMPDVPPLPDVAALPGPAECMPAPRADPLLRVDGTSRIEAPGRSRRAPSPTNEAGTLQTPVELYQAQYQIGLLRAHVTMTMQSSQSLGQSLETALKQSG